MEIPIRGPGRRTSETHPGVKFPHADEARETDAPRPRLHVAMWAAEHGSISQLGLYQYKMPWSSTEKAPASSICLITFFF
jgi:hypothetical protein